MPSVWFILDTCYSPEPWLILPQFDFREVRAGDQKLKVRLPIVLYLYACPPIKAWIWKHCGFSWLGVLRVYYHTSPWGDKPSFCESTDREQWGTWLSLPCPWLSLIFILSLEQPHTWTEYLSSAPRAFPVNHQTRGQPKGRKTHIQNLAVSGI